MPALSNKPVYARLRCVPGLTKEAIKPDAEANIAPSARVVSDGLGCFGGLTDAGLAADGRRTTGLGTSKAP